MFKVMTLILRGIVGQAQEAEAERNALLILDQQIRDVAAGIKATKRALALAVVEDAHMGKRLEDIDARVCDLEDRAIEALRAGRTDLVSEAAEAIAALEADRESIRASRQQAASEIAKLRRVVDDGGTRLAGLERGRRIAKAAEALQHLRGKAWGGRSAITEAEETLAGLRARQAEAADMDAAVAALDADPPAAVSARLEAEGFGPRTRISAADVIARLQVMSVTRDSASTMAMAPRPLPNLASASST
jgi:phage shock protein A